ncbi:MAG: NAD(P)-binding domain-containing protein, partial [Polaromonas sp.]|nr:NAD(P)-binding domain-containing protein [Polaromonas sp.]
MAAIYKTIAVIGAGAMGQGIAQIAAQAGSQVKLFDKDPSASARARQSVSAQWDKLVAKGKMDAEAAAACLARLALPASLAELSDCELVIEAIVERLDVKRALFTELESIVPAQAV